jgi:hypothetical protein
MLGAEARERFSGKYMMDRVGGWWSEVLRWLRVRPPQGHMDMLRGVVARREDERVAHEAAAVEKRRADGAAAWDDAPRD